MRYSWSGDPAPKIEGYNGFGQKLIVDQHNNIIAIYNYSRDLRVNKSVIIPSSMQLDDLVIAKWYQRLLKTRLENKFNQKGWFTCIKDKKGMYCAIHFGNPINFDTWRANNHFWNSLIIDKYE